MRGFERMLSSKYLQGLITLQAKRLLQRVLPLCRLLQCILGQLIELLAGVCHILIPAVLQFTWSNAFSAIGDQGTAVAYM